MRHVLAGVVVLVVAAWTSADAGDAPAQPAEMRVKVIHAMTGAPMAGVLVGGSSQGGKEFKLTTDERGECRIALDPATKDVHFFYQKENFVEGLESFGGNEGRSIPKEFTVKLQPGVR